MPERNLFSKGIHDDHGNKNARKQCLFKEQNYSTASEHFFFVTVYNVKLSNETFYVIEDVATRTMNFLSRFRLLFIIYIDKFIEAK